MSPAGKTALLVGNFLDRPREEFNFDLAILLSDNAHTHKLYEKYIGENIIIVPVSNPYYGLLDYVPAVRRLVRQTLLFCPNPELIVLNSSGGTEKMTNIVKDAGDILSIKHNVLRVFGVYDTTSKDVIFTKKPVVDHRAELDSITADIDEMIRLKETLHGITSVDIDKE